MFIQAREGLGEGWRSSNGRLLLFGACSKANKLIEQMGAERQEKEGDTVKALMTAQERIAELLHQHDQNRTLIKVFLSSSPLSLKVVASLFKISLEKN